jgi:hypothetical protein
MFIWIGELFESISKLYEKNTAVIAFSDEVIPNKILYEVMIIM